jgi:hypothetical protein
MCFLPLLIFFPPLFSLQPTSLHSDLILELLSLLGGTVEKRAACQAHAQPPAVHPSLDKSDRYRVFIYEPNKSPNPSAESNNEDGYDYAERYGNYSQ